MAGRTAAGQGFATFSNLEMQHSPKIFCIFLQKVLAKNSISFDIKSKMMYIGDIAYDVNYEKYNGLDVISKRNEQLHKIGHKIYYDFQINAFLFCKDIYDYSTIHEAPEFL